VTRARRWPPLYTRRPPRAARLSRLTRPGTAPAPPAPLPRAPPAVPAEGLAGSPAGACGAVRSGPTRDPPGARAARLAERHCAPGPRPGTASDGHRLRPGAEFHSAPASSLRGEASWVGLQGRKVPSSLGPSRGASDSRVQPVGTKDARTETPAALLLVGAEVTRLRAPRGGVAGRLREQSCSSALDWSQGWDHARLDVAHLRHRPTLLRGRGRRASTEASHLLRALEGQGEKGPTTF
jgi:hypothetical protein